MLNQVLEHRSKALFNLYRSCRETEGVEPPKLKVMSGGPTTNQQVMRVLADCYGKPWTESDQECRNFKETMLCLENRLHKRLV
jgi:hypothetical protein